MRNTAGAGAAGGMGGGLLALPNVRLRPGVEIVAEAAGLAEKVCGADLVITGEGRIDGQSVRGKTPTGVARIAKQHGCAVIAFAGSLGEGYEAVCQSGIDAVFPVLRRPQTLQQALAGGRENLISAAHNAARLYRLAGG